MFEYLKSTFGPHEKSTIHHPTFNTSFSVVPACGGILTELSLPRHKKGKTLNLLEAPNTYEAWKADNYFQSKWLLPFPNRLKGGRYQFEGKTYQFPINDTNCQNALHGFIYNDSMLVENIDCTISYGQIGLKYDYRGDLAYYPFPFRLEIIYQLFFNELKCITIVKNTGTTPLPIGLGFHPYFQFPSKVDDVHLQLPPCERIEVDERMIPTGKKLPCSNFLERKPIGGTSFDTCFQALPSNGIANSKTYNIHLYNPKSNCRLQYYQETVFPYFQIFTPDHRKSIAIEPMTCNVNAFKNGEGLIVLQPNEDWGGSFGLITEQ